MDDQIRLLKQVLQAENIDNAGPRALAQIDAWKIVASIFRTFRLARRPLSPMVKARVYISTIRKG